MAIRSFFALQFDFRGSIIELTINQRTAQSLAHRTVPCVIFIPSVTTNVIARFDSVIKKNYYNMPWEYDADIRGGAKREHAWWAKYLHGLYFPFWEK